MSKAPSKPPNESASAEKESPPAASAEPAPPETLLRFVKFALLATGDVAQGGDVLRVPAAEAARLIEGGHALCFGVRIKVVRDALIGSVFHVAGDLVELMSDEAIGAHNRGVAILIDPGAIDPAKLQTPPPIIPRIPPRDPWEGVPRVNVRALRNTVVPGGGLETGQEAEVPENWACDAVDAGSVEFTGLIDRLSDRGRKYLDARRNKNPVRPDPVY
jgi:hypothetical protein